MMPPTFLTLPSEVRNLIYREYFAVQGGYVLDFESQKLKAADGSNLDLALMSTCKLIAHETRQIPLGINTITFSTIYSDDARITAGLFNCCFSRMDNMETTRLVQAKAFINPAIYADAVGKFPVLKPFLDWILDEDGIPDQLHGHMFPWYPSISVAREGITYILRLLANHHGMDFHNHTRKEIWCSHVDTLQSVDLCHKPWAIPSQSEVNQMVDVLYGFSHHLVDSLLSGRDRLKYRFSAAAAAIDFLESISGRVRQYIRNIVVHEDRYAVPYQSCHVEGLIPFCKENPRLRIERRVSLWRTIFPEDCIASWNIDMDTTATRNGTFEILWGFDIAKRVGAWLEDTIAALHLGMPHDSMTLVLDGDPAPELCEDIFQKVIQRCAGWKLAYDESCSRKLLPTLDFVKKPRFCAEVFPIVVQHLVDNSSIFRCNFNPGQPLDIASLIDEHRGWDTERWWHHFQRPDQEEFETTPPLPKWYNLVLENFITKKEMKRRMQMGYV
jgi:hypothetical protein